MFELLLTFFISVLSGIVANYVIKWLERKNDHSNDSKTISSRKERENPGSAISRGFRS
jgi:predicted PurR-regulated permease PerM